VKATFFVVGENARRAPEIVRDAFAAGHIIGNHSLAHRRWSSLNPRDDGHIGSCAEVLGDLLGVRPRLYRAPWGWVTPWEIARLRAANYSIIGWDVNTLDWKTNVQPGDRLAERMARLTRPGSILLCHDGWGLLANGRRPETTRAVREFIPRALDLGYEFVTIPELLDIAAYQGTEGM
jgi:peptidoglycan/xylan/chitin deacetylase (PgdA/CDA1 family)